MAGRTIVIPITSDWHCGSTVGLCPPEGVALDDSGEYHPSKAQLWLWECATKFHDAAALAQKDHKALLWYVANGDLADGQVAKSTQIISGNPDAQNYVMRRAFDLVMNLKPDRLFVVRGTEAHTGSSGSTEEAVAKMVGAERDAETRGWSRWRLRLRANGLLLDFQHHGRSGTRPWTKQNALSALACHIWMEHQIAKLEAPAIAIRSHRHIFGDSYDAYPTRLIQTPAYQLKTAYAHKVAAESIADVGGVILVVEPDGQYEVKPVLFKPSLPRIA